MRATWHVDEELHRSVWSRLRHSDWSSILAWWVVPLLICLLAMGPLFALGILLPLVCSVGALRRKVDTSRLRDLPSSVLQVESEVWFYREGFFIGKDTGLFSIVDRWLLFVGNETSFSLPSVRCRPSPFSKRRYRAGQPPDERLIGFETLGHDPIMVIVRPAKGLSKALLENQLRSWLAGKQPVSGEPVEPPISPHPRLRYEMAWTGVSSLAVALAGMAAATLAIGNRFQLPGTNTQIALWPLSAWLGFEAIRGFTATYQWSTALTRMANESHDEPRHEAAVPTPLGAETDGATDLRQSSS